MTDHSSDTATQIADEPVPHSGAGSRDSEGPGSTGDAAPPPPTSPMRDLLRALACAALVAACVAEPSLALVLAPFVPVLIALRLLRRTSGDAVAALRARRSFLVSATAAAIVAAVFASTRDEHVAAAVLGALALVPALGLVHAHAARRDPLVEASADPEPWPEPRAWSGLTPTIAAWTIATILVVATALLATDTNERALAALGVDLVDEAYATYTDSCVEGGALEAQEDLCDRIDQQRVDVRGVVDDHAPELLGLVVALFAFGAAATAHMVVLARARSTGIRVRPKFGLSRLEVHWSFAYVAAAGLGGWLLAAGDEPAMTWLRALAGAVALVGACAIVAQGCGMLAAVVAGARRRGLLTATIIVVLLVASPVAAISLLVLGMLDMWLHPRRRAPAPPAA